MLEKRKREEVIGGKVKEFRLLNFKKGRIKNNLELFMYSKTIITKKKPVSKFSLASKKAVC